MKFENTEVLFDIFTQHGIREKNNQYEVYISNHGKFISIGTYNDFNKAKQELYNFKLKRLINCLKDKELNIEECKVLINYYLIFPSGDIFNIHGKEIIGSINKSGYRNINLKGRMKDVHRIIAAAFIPNPENLPQVNHKDGNKINNNIDNLEWCTCSDNLLHAYANGLEQKQLGEQHHNHKLTEEQVLYIKKNYKPRDPINGANALGKRFGVTRYAIQDIAKKKSWGWLNAI